MGDFHNRERRVWPRQAQSEPMSWSKADPSVPGDDSATKDPLVQQRTRLDESRLVIRRRVSGIADDYDLDNAPPQKRLVRTASSSSIYPKPILVHRVSADDQSKSSLLPPPKAISMQRRRRSTTTANNLISCLLDRETEAHHRGKVEADLMRRTERLMACSTTTRTRSISLPQEAKCTIAVTMSPLDDDQVVSTHGGDHTVKISSFATGQVQRSLAKHPRTPWAVAIHPADSSLIASGCLSGKVCLWKNGHFYREMDLGVEIIMSLAFRQACPRTEGRDLLYIAWGTSVWSWDYSDENHLPMRILQRKGRVQCVCFSGLGQMLTAELLGPLQNLSMIYLWREPDTDIPGLARRVSEDAAAGDREAVVSSPLAHRLHQLHEDDSHGVVATSPSSVSATANHRITMKSVLLLSSIVLYSDGGMSISKCGRFVCAIQSLMGASVFSPLHPTQCQLVVVSLLPESTGQVIRSVLLDGVTSAGLTSVKFSPTDEHIVCGYGVAGRPHLDSNSLDKYCLAVFSNYERNGTELRLEAVKTSDCDDVNVAVFHPAPGFGVLYGTRQGPLRLWERSFKGEDE